MSYDKEKEIAVEAVRIAVALCERVREDIPAAIEKSDKSPVTVADFGAQALICKILGEAFPEDSIVGEEDADSLGKPEMADTLAKVACYVGEQIPDVTPEKVIIWINGGNGTVTSRYWTVDPVDGTKGFLRNDQYAVALALIEEGEVKVGVLGCPAMPLENSGTGVLYVAVRGEGSFMMPLAGIAMTPLQVVGAEDLKNRRFVESVESSHGDQDRQNRIARAAGITAPSLRVDSQAKYGMVASGKAALYLRLPSPQAPDYRENIWDHAAGSIVVEEAGGRVTDMNGKSLDFTAPQMIHNRGVIVSNGIIHDRVLQELVRC